MTEKISQVGSEQTTPVGTSLIEGETAAGTSERYQLANIYKAFKSTLDSLYAAIADAFTDEKAQDAVGGMIADTATVNLTYTDATPELKADVVPGGIKLDDLGTADDNTDLNANTTNHGLLLKATAPAAGLMNFVGLTNAETAYTNKPLFDTTNPANLGSVGPGTQVISARRDHIHAMPSAADVGAATTSTKLDDFATPDDNTDLNANTTNHGLLVKATAPAANELNVVGIANGETAYTNKDLFNTTAPADLAGTASSGTGVQASRSDHVHLGLTSAQLTDLTDGGATTLHSHSFSGALDDLSDVVITSNAQGDILYHNGSNWVNLGPGSSGYFLKTQGAAANPVWAAIPGGGDALVSNPLSQFAATTSLQLLGVISDETGSGALVFGTSPTIATPVLTLKQSATPTPTAEGAIEWDTDNNQIAVGDGAGTKVFSDDSAQVLKADVDDTPANGATTDPISSNWAYDHENLTTAHGATGANVGTTNTQTLTNKRVTPRVTAISSSATPTINTDNCDFVDITALAAAITSMTTNLSGTPTNGQKLIIRFKDDGTARAITWGASFEACGVALPTTTVISKRLTVGFLYDTTTSKWGCVASVNEA